MLRATAIVLFCLFASPAYAMPCWMIKKAVATYGETVAINWAKAHGYSDRDIERVRNKCLRSSQ